MKELLKQLVAGQSLSEQQAYDAFTTLMTGEADAAQMASLLTLLAIREPTIDELVGAATAMRKFATPIQAPEDVVDTCGTGGVHSRIFNVSTTAAIVAAACGVPVAKHGNRGVTSRSGSADVLSALGVKLDASPAIQQRCLNEINICFAFAQKHHPAMKHIAPVRQSLGFTTIFNLCGPLANPAGSRRQLMGVGILPLAEKMLHVLMRMGARRAMVVHGFAGEAVPDAMQDHRTRLCEISAFGPTQICQFDGASLSTYTIRPAELQLPTERIEDVEIATPMESALLIKKILKGGNTPGRSIVLANAAGALWVGGKVATLQEGVQMAAKAIDSGAANITLEKLIAITNHSE